MLTAPRILPRFPGFRLAIGPGIVWMALAQGSGELVWWPWLAAKYGLGLMVLLIPASLLQYPITYELGRYTLLTGESIFHGFLRQSRVFAFLLFILMVVSFLWFGAYALGGGGALAALTNFPVGWTLRAQSLFWAYATIAVYFFALLFSRAAYRLIEKFMWLVAITTVVGLVCAAFSPEVRRVLPEFFAGLVVPRWPESRPWDPADASRLVTAINFAGMGGFWTLFYSYFLLDKGAGMAGATATGMLSDTPMNGVLWRDWRRYLAVDSAIGIVGNIVTTILTCLLAYALLFPQGQLPTDAELITAQSRFFEAQWGRFGHLLFLIIGAAFLSDAWLATTHTVSRIYSDFLKRTWPLAQKYSDLTLYRVFVVALTAITCLTLPQAQPGKLIQLGGLIGFFGSLLYIAALWHLNHRLLPAETPEFARPGRVSQILLGLTFFAYAAIALTYAYLTWMN